MAKSKPAYHTNTVEFLKPELEETRKQLAARSAEVTDLRECNAVARGERDAFKKQADETRKQFADLKQRLHDSEMENQRLRGYVQRVQEDDTVREELIATGDPDGEARMVPKRKSTVFAQPMAFSDFREPGATGYFEQSRNGEKRTPKHWITY